MFAVLRVFDSDGKFAEAIYSFRLKLSRLLTLCLALSAFLGLVFIGLGLFGFSLFSSTPYTFADFRVEASLVTLGGFSWVLATIFGVLSQSVKPKD